MLRDVFYMGSKPNAHPREKYAQGLDHARAMTTTEHFWIINEHCDYRSHDWDFDFDFLPDEEVWTKDHNNIWPSQHQRDSGTWLCPKVGGQYLIYRADVDPVIRKNEVNDNWEVPPDIDTTKFDFSWHPDPTSPPYIYQFGTQLNKEDGPKYVVSNNMGTSYVLRTDKSYQGDKLPRYYIETTLDELIEKHCTEVFWALNKDINYDDFEFNWLPQEHQSNFIHAFGSEDNIDTRTYFVNAITYTKGVTQINYVTDKKINISSTNLDMFYIDRGNNNAESKFSILQLKFPNIKKTRYLNSWIDTINRCANKSTTELFWILDSTLNYDDFKFDYYPNPWQMNMLHVFGTQWGHWGTTFLVNKNTFADDTKYLTQVEHVSGINFVKDKRAITDKCNHDIIIVNHSNSHIENVLQTIKVKESQANISIVEYEGSYLDTLKNIVLSLPDKKDKFVWVISSICDYTNFDFSYICDPYTKDMLHVFASDQQKFGDTFLLEVNAFKQSLDELDDLKNYKINFNNHQRVNRLPAPIIISKNECLPDAITDKIDFPYAIYKTIDNTNITPDLDSSISLWSMSDKNIVITSLGATTIIAPKECYSYIKKEVYDYPYIVKSPRLTKSNPLDIVFLSNGEANADENYEHLLSVTKGLPNSIVRVDGINGRVQAYHAALTASNTPWAFTVFAKLKVNDNFDWNWQPDRLQIAKHYIFYATNPVNGLEYGHQAMISYNKSLVLANIGKGLDFTLDDEHEVVEMNSGIANYNTDEYSTWRTAFREAIKLCQAQDKISKHRLDIWLEKGVGEFAEYSILGAKQGAEYYQQVAGDINKLKYSYEWSWLKEKFNKNKL
jgi:hypothetical protein